MTGPLHLRPLLLQPSRSVWIATALSGGHSSMEVEPVTLSAWVWPPCYVKKVCRSRGPRTEPTRLFVDRLGADAIQEAMTARVPWKALKQLGNNCTPPFECVLQDELAKSIQSRAAGPDPPTCRKKLPKAQPVFSSASLLQLP